METWKQINNYAGIYEVSNHGRVRTAKNKTTYSELHGIRIWKQRVLKLKIDKNGYKRVSLWKNKMVKDFLVHRLVAAAFLENRNEYLVVNHMDGNPSNNSVDNLEWCTSAHNNNHAFDNGLMKTNKDIVLRNTNTNELHHFRSMNKASEFLGKNSGYLSALLLKGSSTVEQYEIFRKCD